MLRFLLGRPTPSWLALLLLLLAAAASLDAATAALSIPPDASDRGADARAAGIAAMAAQIQNEARNYSVGGEVLPFYTGPKPTPGSLTERIRYAEAQKLLSYANPLPEFIARLAVSEAPTLTSLAAIAGLYDKAAPRLDRPMSMDNSDATFGRQRLTIKPMKLRQVRVGEYNDQPFATTDRELAQLCGRQTTWASIRPQRNLYVEDFGDAARWNDPKTAATKYTPNVVGFFCYNRESWQLVPIEIRFPDTGLAYTPLDAADDWTLAKMGLEAASVSFHQMHHMADTHAVTIPIRVELYRAMAPEHPVRALLELHTLLDFGLEIFLANVLLSPNTALDLTWGWGATGTTRFLAHQVREVVARTTRSLEADLADRGLDDLPTHAFALYARRLNDAIDRFVLRYLRNYYRDDAAVANDHELQAWARGCAAIPQVFDFPEAITTLRQLKALVRDLVYQSTVKHHAMNGMVTWQSMAPPYSPAALWRPLPTTKLPPGARRTDLLAYTTPIARLPLTLGLSAAFVRPPPANETLPQAYRREPFRSEPGLAKAIADFEADLARIDAFIAARERHERFPYVALRPSTLPYYVWI